MTLIIFFMVNLVSPLLQSYQLNNNININDNSILPCVTCTDNYSGDCGQCDTQIIENAQYCNSQGTQKVDLYYYGFGSCHECGRTINSGSCLCYEGYIGIYCEIFTQQSYKPTFKPLFQPTSEIPSSKVISDKKTILALRPTRKPSVLTTLVPSSNPTCIPSSLHLLYLVSTQHMIQH